MMLPKRTKYRKTHKGRLRGTAQRGATIAFGEFGLQTLECGKVTNRQLEAGRVAISRHMKRVGKMWIRVFPDTPVTGKPLGVRQGSGKGNVEGWVAPVQRGVVLFELGGVDEATAKEAMRLASSKLPIKTRMISREKAL